MKSMAKVLMVLALGVFICLPGVAGAITVTPGYTIKGESILGDVRYHQFAGTPASDEIYLGFDGLGTATNRVQAKFGYGEYWLSTNPITFTYDPATNNGTLTSISPSTLKTSTLQYNPVGGLKGNATTEPLASHLDLLNYMKIDVVNRASGTTVNFNNVYLNGTFLGNFSASGWQTWEVTDFNFSNGFTLTGDIILAGTQPNQETNKVDIGFGYSTNAPQFPLPPSALLLGSGLVGLGWRRRKAS